MKAHVKPPFELVFATNLREIVASNLRWSKLRRDLEGLVCRRADYCSEPHEKQTLDTVVEVYLAPLNKKDNGCDQSPVVFRETVKHFRMKYPEFVASNDGRYTPTFTHHNRGN